MKLNENASEYGGSSVGERFADNQIYSLQHPQYESFSRAVEQQLEAITQRELVRRSTAQVFVHTSELDTDELSRLASSYPEFSLVQVPLNSRVQGYWSASRACANEWLAKVTSKYAATVVHYGGSLTASVGQRRRGFHIESDGSDEVMVNDAHSDVVDLHRLYGDFSRAAQLYNLALPRVEYDDYLRGTAYKTCSAPHKCTHEAEALCVDLSVSAISPEQVAMAMMQHKAKLCHGFFPYCPEMLVQDEGDLGESGVSFKRKDKYVYFTYPEGRAGVQRYPLSVWSRWVASHTFSVGTVSKTWFQLELLNRRDCFMFFRLIQLEGPPASVKVMHALDLERKDDYVLVSSWRLKSGLKSDPTKSSEWEPYHFLARTRIVKRVYEFAMQLQPNQFSRFAIKKQIRIVNNRWVVNGTSVSVAPALDPGKIEDLTTAIFSRAFVDRYESSRLSAEMMSKLKSLARFTEATTAERLAMVGSAVMTWLMAPLNRVNDKVRSVLDDIINMCSSDVVLSKVQVRPAPNYILLVTQANAWKTFFSKHGEKLYTDPRSIGVGDVQGTALGGSLASVVSSFDASAPREASDLRDVIRVCTRIVDFRQASVTPVSQELVSAVTQLNVMDSAAEARFHVETSVPILEDREVTDRFATALDPDPVTTLNDLYASFQPGVARQQMEYDSFSLSLDPQDRTLAAPYLKMPTYFGLPPVPRMYYRSRVKALNVPKRQTTSQELLSAMAARNLSAPAISVPQEETMIRDIWENFLDTMCVPDARGKLAEFGSDLVGLESEALVEWAAKAKDPKVVERVAEELKVSGKSLAEMPISEYIAMIKSDVKPTLSDKPLREVTAPQVIVYHQKALSAMYSSMFRVLVQRFMSLLKPEYFVNLLKDVDYIAKHLTAVHPFAETGLQYLENDFSKFDKSQSQFAFDLEYFVFQKLGLSPELLSNWLKGHVDCNLRAVGLGLSLHVLYQRKSGDATTAFGNVILNVLSVAFAYRGTDMRWAVFMGDDSIVCARKVNAEPSPVQILAEVFNLTAKYYVTDAPYFASNFIVIDQVRCEVILLPDPIKRIERLSMHISADDPQWDERYVSFQDAMAGYRDPSMAYHLARLVPQRYEVEEGLVRAGAWALGTLAAYKKSFREVWEDEPEMLSG